MEKIDVLDLEEQLRAGITTPPSRLTRGKVKTT